MLVSDNLSAESRAKMQQILSRMNGQGDDESEEDEAGVHICSFVVSTGGLGCEAGHFLWALADLCHNSG